MNVNSNNSGVSTVTVAPIGLFSSICDITVFIVSSPHERLSFPVTSTLTVPFPFQSGYTFTLPTPSHSKAHAL